MQNEEAPVEASEETESSEEPAQSALTDRDIADKINRKLYETDRRIFMWFPEEKIVWAKAWGDKATTVYVYTYVVEGEEVILSEPSEKELVVSMLEVNEEVVSLRNEVSSLKEQNEELAGYKKIVEDANAEKALAEHNAKVDALRNKAIESECFSAEEISELEAGGCFSELKENELNAKIVDRMMKNHSQAKEISSKEIEKKEEKMPIKRVVETSESTQNRASIMRDFIFGKN